MTATTPHPVLALSMRDFCTVTGIGRTRAFALLRAGKFEAKKNGRKLLIPADEAQRFVDSLPGRTSAAG